MKKQTRIHLNIRGSHRLIWERKVLKLCKALFPYFIKSRALTCSETRRWIPEINESAKICWVMHWSVEDGHDYTRRWDPISIKMQAFWCQCGLRDTLISVFHISNRVAKFFKIKKSPAQALKMWMFLTEDIPSLLEMCVTTCWGSLERAPSNVIQY